MSDTARTTSSLQTIFATNGTGAITAQNLRDFVVSSLNTLDVPVSTFIKTLLDDTDAATARATLGCASTAHASSHASGGTDAITVTEAQVTSLVSDLAGKAATVHTHAASDVTSGTMATARLGSGSATSSTFLRGDQTYAGITQGNISGLVSALSTKLGNPPSGDLIMATHDISNAGNITAVGIGGSSAALVLTTDVFLGSGTLDASMSGTIKTSTLKFSGIALSDRGDGQTVYVDGDGFLKLSTGG